MLARSTVEGLWHETAEVSPGHSVIFCRWILLSLYQVMFLSHHVGTISLSCLLKAAGSYLSSTHHFITWLRLEDTSYVVKEKGFGFLEVSTNIYH